MPGKTDTDHRWIGAQRVIFRQKSQAANLQKTCTGSSLMKKRNASLCSELLGDLCVPITNIQSNPET